MTHKELCVVACRWLAGINRRHLVALFRESHYLLGEQADAFAVWSPVGVTHMVECKVSRSDFLADKHKPWRKNPEQGLGAIRSYLTLPGVIRDKSEVPDCWNWYEYNEETDSLVARFVPDPPEWMGQSHFFANRRNGNGEWELFWLYQRSKWWKRDLNLYTKPVNCRFPKEVEDD